MKNQQVSEKAKSRFRNIQLLLVIKFLSCFPISGRTQKNVGIIKADVSDSASLGEMAKQGRIVLNCVGPYRLDQAKTHENLEFFLFLNDQCN